MPPCPINEHTTRYAPLIINGQRLRWRFRLSFIVLISRLIIPAANIMRPKKNKLLKIAQLILQLNAIDMKDAISMA